MGLARYALVFGLGYAAGTPAGRAQLRALPARLSALARRPQAQQLRDRGKAVAGQAVQTAKERLGSGSSRGDSSPGDSAPGRATGSGATLTDDPDVAVHGTLPPGPVPTPRST
jgi:hypothetical protein